MRHGRWIVLGAGVVATVAIDQLTKAWAMASLPLNQVVPKIDGFFELHYTRNPGAFFNLGAELPLWARTSLFLIAALIAVGFIGRLYAKSEPQHHLLRTALVFLMGGAIGNAIDRARQGEVTDFLHLHWRSVIDWATFNMADAWITMGLVLLVIDMLTARRTRPSVRSESVS